MMKISELSILNFKNFASLNVKFSDGVNLFVGGNGSGKTSILEAVNIAIAGFFGSQEQKMQRFIEFDEIKITNGKREIQTSIIAKSDTINGEWARTIKRDTKANDTKGIKSISDYGAKFFKLFDVYEDKTIAPLIAFYSTQRLFKDASLSGKQKYDTANGRRNGYIQCLKENAIKVLLNEWLSNAVTRRATMKIKEIENVDLVLDNVEAAIRKTLILFLNLPQDFSLKIYQDPDFDNELYVNYDNEHNLPISYYSDGFRNLLYLVFDLAWRASQLNPTLNLMEITESVFGVVTIDEIDLHLHPKWQAKAIEIIQLLFPKVQFFVTTHSPTVVANFQNGTLYTISDNAIEKHSADFFGKNINNILRNILGASDRHVPTQNKLNGLFRLIDEGEIGGANILLAELHKQLGDEDVDINKAKALIEMHTLEIN